MAWFRDLTGLDRDDPATVRAEIEVQGDHLLSRANGRRTRPGALTVPSLADLRAATPGPATAPALREVVADVQALHLDPAHDGATFQVASQFNLLEMPGPTVTPDQGIAAYDTDRTQGPACAIACGAGTLWRNYFVPLEGQTGQSRDRQIDALADLGAALGNQAGRLWAMRNGYATPDAAGLREVSDRIAAATETERDHWRGLLRVGVQTDSEVTLNHAGHGVTQVFCSALPIGYSDLAAPAWEPFARLVLEAAYEATMRAAIVNARTSGTPRLFLTLLGGGVFRNDASWITGAIARALQSVPGQGLDVCLVSHGRPSGLPARIARP